MAVVEIGHGLSQRLDAGSGALDENVNVNIFQVQRKRNLRIHGQTWRHRYGAAFRNSPQFHHRLLARLDRDWPISLGVQRNHARRLSQ